MPKKKAKSTFQAKEHETGNTTSVEVILASRESGSMASSWTDQLVLRREADGRLVMMLERVGMDAVPEEEWDAEAWAELHYESAVEGPSWLCDFLEEPHWKVEDRVARSGRMIVGWPSTSTRHRHKPDGKPWSWCAAETSRVPVSASRR